MAIAIVAPTSVGARGMHVDLVVVVIIMLLLLLLLNFKPEEDVEVTYVRTRTCTNCVGVPMKRSF
jgi:uncharacterized integral membrane protein